MSFSDRLQHAWNAFMNKDPTAGFKNRGGGYSYRPDRPRFSRGNEKSIVTSIYNRIALDASQIELQHIKVDENKRYLEEVESDLNYCFNTEANKDQTPRAFIQDIVMSMFDEGNVAVFPVDYEFNLKTEQFNIYSMRTAKILEYFPDEIRIRAYNDRNGKFEEILLPKKTTAIIENPFFAVMNEPNSTLQRLIHKLALLDYVDEQTSSGKLDLIIQLPYVIKTEARRQQAENRRKDIEDQLAGSKYGIAYTDGTEHITQLNRSLENNLLKQIENLTSTLYSQLGITVEIMNGSADSNTMNNYYNRTIEPIMSAIVDEMKRKFLTKEARANKETICYFRDPFKLLPVSEIAEMADKMTRNEIMTSNEIRQVIGMKPAKDPSADELRNKNLSEAKGEEHVNKNGIEINKGSEDTN